MKKSFFILSGLLSVAIVSAQEMTVDEIVSNNLKAIGQEKLMTFQTIKETGKMTQGPAEFIITEVLKKPEYARLDMEIQGIKIILSTDGQTGWMVNPATGMPDPQDLPEDMIKSMMDDSREAPDVNWDNPFLNWKEKGTKIDLIGKEDLKGTAVYNLNFTFSDGGIVNYYVDVSRFIVLKKKSTESAQGQTYEKEEIYSDFKDFNGILCPGKVESYINGQISTTSIIENYEFNLPFEVSFFKKP